MCVCRHITAYVWRSEDNWQALSVEPVFPFQHENSGDQTQVIDVGSKLSYLLSPLSSSESQILKWNFIYRKSLAPVRWLSQQRAGHTSLRTWVQSLKSTKRWKREPRLPPPIPHTLNWSSAWGHRVLNPIHKKRRLGKKSGPVVPQNRSPWDSVLTHDILCLLLTTDTVLPMKYTTAASYLQ